MLHAAGVRYPMLKAQRSRFVGAMYDRPAAAKVRSRPSRAGSSTGTS